MKWQYVVTHTISHNEIPSLLDSWVEIHLLSQCCLSLYFHKNITSWSAGLLRIGQVFYFPIKLCVSGLQQIAVFLSDKSSSVHNGY